MSFEKATSSIRSKDRYAFHIFKSICTFPQTQV